MRKFIGTLLFFLCGWIMVKAMNQVPDSLSRNAIEKLIYSYPDSALQRLELARDRKALPDYQLDWLTADAYLQKKYFRLALKYRKRVLECDSVQMKQSYYLNALHNLCEAYMMVEDYEQVLKVTHQNIAIVDKMDKQFRDQKTFPYWYMARVYFKLNDYEKAFPLLQESMKLYDERLQRLIKNKKYIAHSLYEKVRRQVQISVDCYEMELYEDSYRYAEESYRTLDETSSLVGVPDANRSIPLKVYNAIKSSVYSSLAVSAKKLGKKKEAQKWLLLLEEDAEYKDLLSAYMKMEEYSRALPVLKDWLKTEEASQISEDSQRCYQWLATCLKKTGHVGEAYQYMEKADCVKDSLFDRLLESGALEFSILYKTKEKEAQVHLLDAELKTQRVVTWLVVIVTLVVIGFLWYIWKLYREIKRKSYAMVQQIESCQLEKQRLMALVSTANPSLNGEKVNESNDLIMEEEQLFLMLDNAIRSGKLFLNPSLSVEGLSDALKINKSQIRSLIQKATGLGVVAYLNNVRLELALEQLANTNDTIEAIADETGFGSARSFYRIFKDKYGMTPNDYRLLVTKKG